MIVSASRRTDIPCYFSEWFINRLKVGSVKVRNPFNAGQIRTVSLLRKDVDCFVFWTKDPKQMIERLNTLDVEGYSYYFQFTLNPYGADLERSLRDKSELVKTFKELSQRIGSDKVLWRYDPIILNQKYTVDFHKNAFSRLCDSLSEHTKLVQISFVDKYSKVVADIGEVTKEDMHSIGEAFGKTAKEHGIAIQTCCEDVDFSEMGFSEGACIDRALIERIIEQSLKVKRDASQRKGCRCVQSVDIGVYNTCKNGCIYCYANHSRGSIDKNLKRHNPIGEEMIEAKTGGSND